MSTLLVIYSKWVRIFFITAGASIQEITFIKAPYCSQISIPKQRFNLIYLARFRE